MPPLGVASSSKGAAHRDARTTGGEYGTKGPTPRLQAATAAARGTTGGVGGDRRHVLNAANLDATTRERPERRLRTRSRRLGAVATLRRVRERAQSKGQEAEVEGRGEKGVGGGYVAGP